MDERNIEKQRRRKRKKQHRKRIVRLYTLFFIVMALIFILTALVVKEFQLKYSENPPKVFDMWFDNLEKPDGDSRKPVKDSKKPVEDSKKSLTHIQVDLNHLNSSNSILMDLSSGKVLDEHNSSERIYPASLTKIMTAIIAIENIPDLNQTLLIPSEIFQDLYSQNASLAGFLPDEKVKYKDALYGILLPSGAECCLAIADSIAGSESAFVEMMNQKAADLGMKNTHFCNTTGLHDDNHYSTVKDFSILLKYALKNDTFREAFTSRRYSTTPSNSHPDGFTFYSTMFKYMDSAEITGGEILGGKTGYTSEAGLCLASLASVNGNEYILVTAHADGTHQTEQFHIMDAVNVYSQIGSVATN